MNQNMSVPEQTMFVHIFNSDDNVDSDSSNSAATDVNADADFGFQNNSKSMLAWASAKISKLWSPNWNVWLILY